MGLGELERRQARQLAGRGLVAFAADLYGPRSPVRSRQEGFEAIKPFSADRGRLLQRRLGAALRFLKALPCVQADKVSCSPPSSWASRWACSASASAACARWTWRASTPASGAP